MLKLNKRRKGKKRLPSHNPAPLQASPIMNGCWSADFMSDALWSGRKFRIFNVVDDSNREALAIEVDLSLPARRVIDVLDRIAAGRGYPEKLRLDNGPEFVSVTMADWAERNQEHLEFIQSGRPLQNGFIARFNRTYREAVLDIYIYVCVFNTLTEVREITDQWIKDYNEERGHAALGNLTPKEFRLLHAPETSNLAWT